MRRRSAHTRNLTLSFALAALLGACAAPPPVKRVSRQEIVEHDNALGADLTPRFEAQLRIDADRELSVFLRKLAQSLSQAAADLKTTNVGVLVVRDPKGPWRNFGLPGNRVYLSAGLLRRLEFENEVAAAIAFQLSHIQKRHLVDRMLAPAAAEARLGGGRPEPLKPVDFFGTDGAFAFKEDAELEAAEGAIEILYQSGYDPRGMLGVWEAYLSHPKQSPFDASLLQKLVERTRNAISKYAPLRNPIVRSAEFISIQKRIKKL